MSKQVDVKALISHVIRGDGVNKCRICMGDTSEGQVHLRDIVLMEGDKPVTLSEVLEIVTGIQVSLDGDLPAGVCKECFNCAVNAANFRSMCRETCSKWDLTLQLLHNLPSDTEKNKTMFTVINDNQMIVVIDEDELNSDTASERLTKHLTKQLDKNEVSEEKTLANKSDCNKVVKTNSQIKNDDELNVVTKSERLEKHITLDKNKSCITVAQCPNCNKTFQHPLKLHHHLKGSTDMKRACHICCKIMSHDDLMSHLVKTHNIKVYDCKKCPALLLTRKMYKQHLTKAHSRGVCTCIDCGQTFQTSQAFHAHISVHRHKTCPNCDKVFRNQTCYLYHVKNCYHFKPEHFKTKMRVEVKNGNSKRNVTDGVHRRTEEQCICDYCNKKFAKKKYVAAHIQIVHMKTTHSPCAYCGKFLATAHMTEHIKKHEIDLSFTCEHCGIVLKTKLGYVQHLRLHTGERPYACKICKETFSASSRRSEHMRKMHKGTGELRHACKLCPAKFRLPYKLRKHMMSSHINDSDETLQFECKECHEKFGSCRGLLHHSRKHQNVPFPHKKPEKSIVLKLFSELNSDGGNNLNNKQY